MKRSDYLPGRCRFLEKNLSCPFKTLDAGINSYIKLFDKVLTINRDPKKKVKEGINKFKKCQRDREGWGRRGGGFHWIRQSTVTCIL